jgi:hypothetical protein
VRDAVQKASIVWPDSVRPLLSVMVTLSMIGRRPFSAANTSSIATRRPWR